MTKGFFVGVDGIAKKVKQGFIGVGGFTPRELPDGYTQVEYIQSSGTQYIDTGFYPNQDTRVVTKVKFASTPTTHSALFGARNSNTNQYWCYYRYSDSAYSIRYGTTSDKKIAASATDEYKIDMNGNILTVGVSTIESTEATFTSEYSMYLFATNNAGTKQYAGSFQMYSCQVYDNGDLVRDFVPCINSSGTAGLYDLVNNVFYTNAGTGTFTVGSSDPNAAVARRIKKAYIGIGGVARPCWSGGELAYYGTTTALSAARYDMGATTVGDYALFAGGYADTVLKAVDAYDKSLTRSTPTELNLTIYNLGATTVGSYALFGGGISSGSPTNAVYAYDTSLTRSFPTTLSKARKWLIATTVGDYALFGGGYTSSSYSSIVDAYDTSLTRSTPTALSVTRYNLGATTVGDYALFGGGYAGSALSTVDAYDTSLTRSIPESLNGMGGHYPSATTVGDYALFTGAGRSGTVSAYDKSLTLSSPTSLSTARGQMGATTVGDYALFAGGHLSTAVPDATVDVYDKSLIRSSSTSLNTARAQMGATTVGDYAIFGGGYRISGGTYYDIVEAYTVA